MHTPYNWGVVAWPVFPGAWVSAVRLSVSGENSRWGRKKCGGNKNVYARVSVSEDGAQTTRPGGVRGAACVRSPQQSAGSSGKGGLVHAHTTRARFEQCIMPHLAAAYNLARWLTRHEQDAEDVVQEACLRAYKFFGNFHGGIAVPGSLPLCGIPVTPGCGKTGRTS